MAIVRLTKEFSFEMAHALWNYDGPCRNIHGHSYRLFVTIVGEPLLNTESNRNGMLLDFSDLKTLVMKQVIDRFDHALVVSNASPDHFIKNVEQMFEKFHKLSYQPTCENLIVDMANRIKSGLPAGIILHSLKLYETATSFAEWFASDNT
jgi:6-pyruvoyltetrahydropterin/6-carboxytetrahydropterin synthase